MNVDRTTPHIVFLTGLVLVSILLSATASFLINGKNKWTIVPRTLIRRADYVPLLVASRSLMAGYSIYENNASRGAEFADPLAKENEVRYVYPPLASYLFAPLALIPEKTSYLIWSFAQIAIILAFTVITAGQLNFKPRETAVLAAVVLLSYPVAFSVERGNFDALVMLFYLSSFFFWLEKRNDRLVAFFLAVAILLKLFPVALLLFFILKKEWSVVVWTIVFSMFLSVVFGLEFLPEYGANFAGLLASLARSLFIANHSTVCFILRAQAICGWFSEEATRMSVYLSHLINLLLFIFIAFHSWKWRKSGKLNLMLEICAYLLFMSVASAISYDYKLVFMCFVVPVLIRALVEMNGRERHCCLTAVIYICVAHCLTATWCLTGNHSALPAVIFASKFPVMVALIIAIVRMNGILIDLENSGIQENHVQSEKHS